MRIAIIGAGYPGLIVARELNNRGHNVDVFGKREAAGVLSGMGPRHLWDNPAFEELPAYDENLRRNVVKVRWLQEDRLVRVHPAMPIAQRLYPGYWHKARGQSTGSPPCAGRTEFDTIANGFAFLDHSLVLAEIEPIPSPVTEIVYLSGTKVQAHEFRVQTATSAHGPYDRLVTTLSPIRFAGLMPTWYDSKCPAPKPAKVSYYWAQKPAFLLGLAGKDYEDLGKGEAIVYNGDLSYWWYRASTVGDRGWCFEAVGGRGPRLEDWEEEAAEAYTQLAPFDGHWSYPPHVTPVGRFAEWDGELMVDGVYARKEQYVTSIVKGTSTWVLRA